MKRFAKLLVASALTCIFYPDVQAASAATETILYSFQNDGKDGNHPGPAPLRYLGGSLYGTTPTGGSYNNCANDLCGTVFSFDPTTNTETVLHSFQANGKDGYYPSGGLVNLQTTLYGTTNLGGNRGCAGNLGCGTVFSIEKKGGKEAIVHAFAGGNDGDGPSAGLIKANEVIFYGTTTYGGGSGCSGEGCGTVFSIDPTTGAETVLYAFRGDGADGYWPNAGVVDVGGTLYGTTMDGPDSRGKRRVGTMFSVDPQTGAESVFDFTRRGGRLPSALIGVNDNLYGTAELGGVAGYGVIFEVNRFPPWNQRVLYTFQGGTDGAEPYAGLLNVNGKLYGTTYGGGDYGLGTVFAYNLRTGQKTVVHSFAGSPDGANPSVSLIDVAGTLYGTTEVGGTGTCQNGCGTIFSITP